MKFIPGVEPWASIVQGVVEAVGSSTEKISKLKELDVVGRKNKVKEMKIMLDGDAQKQALYYVDYYSKQGIMVTNIVPTNKDASSMGFEAVNSVIKDTQPTTFADIISQKLKNL